MGASVCGADSGRSRATKAERESAALQDRPGCGCRVGWVIRGGRATRHASSGGLRFGLPRRRRLGRFRVAPAVVEPAAEPAVVEAREAARRVGRDVVDLAALSRHVAVVAAAVPVADLDRTTQRTAEAPLPAHAGHPLRSVEDHRLDVRVGEHPCSFAGSQGSSGREATHLRERLLAGEDRDERLGRPAVRRRSVRSLRHLDERVGPTLRGRTGELVDRRLAAEAVPCFSPVLREQLALDALERRTHRLARDRVQLTVEVPLAFEALRQVQPPAVDLALRTALCVVRVDREDPRLDHPSELLEALRRRPADEQLLVACIGLGGRPVAVARVGQHPQVLDGDRPGLERPRATDAHVQCATDAETTRHDTTIGVRLLRHPIGGRARLRAPPRTDAIERDRLSACHGIEARDLLRQRSHEVRGRERAVVERSKRIDRSGQPGNGHA